MKKVIVRKKVYSVGRVLNNYFRCLEECECKEMKDLRMKISMEEIVSRIYEEKLEDIPLLLSKYEECEKTYEENEYFKVIYKINEKFLVEIKSNIYLYRVAPIDECLEEATVPWVLAGEQKYIGDPWWESDEEIINNIQSLSIIDFFEQYKGF